MKTQSRFPFLLAVLAIPLDSQGPWEVEKYSRLPAHTVNFSPEGLRIQVKESASPLFYPLPPQTKALGFKVEGEFRGLPQFPAAAIQGEKGADDFALRVGFIVPGDKQLSGLKKLLAPEWIKNLYSKLPKGLGLDHVHFFNITQNPAQVNSSRTHPASELIQEEMIAVVTKPGPFQYEFTMKKPLAAAALWIGSDGDDTKSNFEVVISKLEIRTEP